MIVWLPELIRFEDYENDWELYEEALYQIYLSDLYTTPLHYNGKHVKTRYHPPSKNKAFTFWHITHEGENEDERLPDLRRCERLGWIRPTIENCGDVCCWKRNKKSKLRHYFWIPDETYLIVLEERRDCFMLITAFYVERASQVEKYNREYETYK